MTLWDHLGIGCLIGWVIIIARKVKALEDRSSSASEVKDE